ESGPRTRLQSGTARLQLDRMIFFVELLVFGIETEKVIALLIFQRALNSEVNVVVVEDGEPAGFTRQVNQPFLRIEVLLRHARQPIGELRSSHSAGVVGGRRHERL